jgi:hypothetical protein
VLPPFGHGTVTLIATLNGTGMAFRFARVAAEEAADAAAAVNPLESCMPIWRASSLVSSAVKTLSGAVESLHAAAANSAAPRSNARGRRRAANMGEISLRID